MNNNESTTNKKQVVSSHSCCDSRNDSTKIVFFGTPDFVVPVLETLCKNFEVVGVVTAPDKAVGRKQILTPSPIKLASQEDVLQDYNLKIFTPEKLDQDFCDKLQALNPELFVVAAYGKIIPQNILDIPRKGAINIHPSLLPKYRGASPIQSAILAGDKVTGISIIKMDEKMDHGPIIYAEEFIMLSQDNFRTLSTKMFVRSALLLPKIIPAFTAGKIKLVEQNESDATFCKMIKKEDGYLDLKNFNDSPTFFEKLNRMIQAYYPWPTAWTRWNNKIVKFLPFTVIPSEVETSTERGNLPNNGRLPRRYAPRNDNKKTTQNDKFLVQMEGKKPVILADFLHGYPNFPIKNLN